MGEFKFYDVATVVHNILYYSDFDRETIKDDLNVLKAQLLECDKKPYHIRGHEDNEKVRILNGVIHQLEMHLRGGNYEC